MSLSELSDVGVETLSGKNSCISDTGPKEWAEEFKQNRDNLGD